MAKQDLVNDVIHQIENLLNNITAEDYEKKILEEILQEPDYEALKDVSLSLAECHVIDIIERNIRFNTTAIAQQMNMTKGAISKITAKLAKKNLIEVQRLPNNQKEIYFKSTSLGKKVFQVHEALHKKAEEAFAAMLNGYSAEEIVFAQRLLNDLITVFQSKNIE